ncbi:MAG: hypothetical protein WBA40_00815, partial [Roseiarcus sp.]
MTTDRQPPVQNRAVSFESAACCFLVSADAMLRARPAIAFALLNHILMSGFFFNQGFFIRLFLSSNLSCLIDWRASRPGRERASLPRVESSSRGAF